MGSRSKAACGARASLFSRQHGARKKKLYWHGKRVGYRDVPRVRFTDAVDDVLKEAAAKRKKADAENDPQTTANRRRRARTRTVKTCRQVFTRWRHDPENEKARPAKKTFAQHRALGHLR